MDRAVRWLVSNRRTPLDVPGEIARLGSGVAALLPQLPELFRGRELEALREHMASLEDRGLPADVAGWATRLFYAFGLLDVVEVARATGRDLDEVASVYFLLSEQFRVDELLSKVSQLPREDRWQTLARMALRYDLYAALAALTTQVLTTSDAGLSAEAKVREWEAANASGIGRARKATADFDESRADLASLSVLLRQIRTLVRSSSAP
jgi:glutamate dehydrogenase